MFVFVMCDILFIDDVDDTSGDDTSGDDTSGDETPGDDTSITHSHTQIYHYVRA